MLSGVRGVLVGLAVTTAVVLTTATAAFAADGWQPASDVADSTYDEHPDKTCAYADGDTLFSQHGRACFQNYGEWVWVMDEDANNIPVAMRWWFHAYDGSGDRSGVIYDTLGKASGWTNVNKSFPSGEFRFQACEVNISTKKIYSATCGYEEMVINGE